jgi:hypothetical protein
VGLKKSLIPPLNLIDRYFHAGYYVRGVISMYFGNIELSRARKMHQCEFCKTDIVIGDEHLSFIGSVPAGKGKRFWQTRLHEACMTAYVVGKIEDRHPRKSAGRALGLEVTARTRRKNLLRALKDDREALLKRFQNNGGQRGGLPRTFRGMAKHMLELASGSYGEPPRFRFSTPTDDTLARYVIQHIPLVDLEAADGNIAVIAGLLNAAADRMSA